MENLKITKQEEKMNYLTDQFCKFVAELFDEDISMISKKEIEDFQNDIRELIKDFCNTLELVVKVKYRKGHIKSNLGCNINRNVRLSNVLKKGIVIPSDVTYFELKLLPAIIVKNRKKGKEEIKDIDIELKKVTVFTGEASIETGKVVTGRGEYYSLEDDCNKFIWGIGTFNTRLIKLKEVEHTICQ